MTPRFVGWQPPPPPLGELLVKMIMAESLRRSDTLMRNDTFVTLQMLQTKGSDAVVYSKHRTTTVFGTTNPVFADAAFSLRVRDKYAQVVVEVVNEDIVGDDDLLGAGCIDMSELMKSPGVPRIQNLSLEGAPSSEAAERPDSGGCGARHQHTSACATGVVRLELTFHPNPAGGFISEDHDSDWMVSVDDPKDFGSEGKPPASGTTLWVAVMITVCFASAAVVCFVLLLTKQAEFYGCTDPIGINYNPAADTNRGCAFAACAHDAGCGAPRGECVAQFCSCAPGWSGRNCDTVEPRWDCEHAFLRPD